MPSVLLIITESPYGTERPYHALRLAGTLLESGVSLDLFLMSDAVVAALDGQSSANEDLNLGRRLAALMAKGARVHVCGLCMETRGLHHASLVEGVQPASMPDLVAKTLAADRTLTF